MSAVSPANEATVDTTAAMDPYGLPCVHCGLCLDTCPTYRVLGTEADSPRGRIYIMEAVNKGELVLDGEAAEHLDGCLGCLACETACPSGVSFATRIEKFRPLMEPAGLLTRAWDRAIRYMAAGGRPLAFALRAARALDRLGLGWLRNRLPGLGLMPGTRASCEGVDLTPLHRSSAPQPLYPRMRVAVLTGCVGDRLLPGINRDAIEVLQKNGVEVVEVAGQGCCGALDLHDGRKDAALKHVHTNVEVFGTLLENKKLDYIITTAAGCGAMQRDYARLFSSKRAALVSKQTKDICEFLVEIDAVPPENRGRVPNSASEPGHREPDADVTEVVYHDACHLKHACGIASAPRRIVELATGQAPEDLGDNDLCCGSAGSYNLQHPRMAAELGSRKAELAAGTDASVVAVGNAGCILQLGRSFALAGLDKRVAHPVELLAEAYRAAEPDDAPEPGAPA